MRLKKIRNVAGISQLVALTASISAYSYLSHDPFDHWQNMAKDKKSKTAEKKARLAAKQSKKATQKEKKAKSKRTDDSDVEDVDLDTLLADYAKQVREIEIEILLWLTIP